MIHFLGKKWRCKKDASFLNSITVRTQFLSSRAAVCVFRTAWECNQGVWSLSFFWVSFLFLFWLWNETLCLVTPFVSHLGGFYTDTQLIFPILFFFLSNYYSSHFYICITLLLYVGVQIRPKFMVANKIKFMSYIRFCLT